MTQPLHPGHAPKKGEVGAAGGARVRIARRIHAAGMPVSQPGRPLRICSAFLTGVMWP